MAYQTLYRKYRPNSFELVFGQNIIVKTLKNVIKNDKLSHAYLFTGPRGTGKTSCAKLFAKAVNCNNNIDGDVCNNCSSCNSYNKNSNPDIIEIDAASNNGVDEIREIKNKISLVPSFSKYKVYIIDEVHMLSIGAFNALLKTLEEPPEYVIFILATTEPQKLPATVISRCQRFDFKSISNNDMKECLKRIISKEKIIIEEDAIDEIIESSKGAMRDAIGLLDQAASFSDSKIVKDDIINLSGNINDEDLYKIFDIIFKNNYRELFNISERLNDCGKDFCLIMEKMINYVGDEIINRKTKNYNKNIIFENVNVEKLYGFFNFLSDVASEIEKTYYKNTFFVIKMIQLIETIVIRKDEEQRKENVLKTKSLKSEIIDEKKQDVSRETSSKNADIEKKEILKELKNIRINNILKESKKEELRNAISKWENLKKYIYDSKYKISAGILTLSKPVASSENGMIITCKLESSVERIEDNYDESKELLSEIFGKKYKIVYITEKKWEDIRPQYILKIKNNSLNLINEKEYLEKIKNKQKENNNSVKEFDELIVMEEKE